ncbi:ubiquitin-like protein 7 isoform X2 [Mercenaria mercenaria]|uniref:ubiquitin-like protein 7 isoform X2 n=1 Tax=Mercenaria mercenaria TaxID=6596 RepID=UPI00234EE467|nr:ubiquitin-like protein 7 isoform X2 [Mercenaria mercenaria]
MASVIICDRISQGNTGRKELTGVRLDQDVKILKEKIAADLKITENLFDVIYCGQCLKEGASLESNGVHQGSTVHVVARPVQDQNSPGEIANTEVKQLLSLLQTTLKSPAYKSTVENIVNSPDLLHDIVKDVPGLDSSPSTITLFMDHELLTVLAHPGNIRRVIEAHACFPQVAKKIAEAVKEADSIGEYTRSSTGAYSLDQMSDDEDEMPGPSGGQAITSSQLAAALAAATGSSGQSNQSEPIGGGVISSDFFQQAILAAQRDSLSSQVQQMREMGITDENVARQALQATNGDLQAALDLLFGGGVS